MKKRSGANSASRRPPKQDLVFFLDRQLGRYKMAGLLRNAGFKVEVHDDHFPPNARDAEWLTAVGKKGWIVVTRDERIRYRVAEKHALRCAKVKAFVLAAQGNLRAEMLAEIFLKAVPKITKIVAEQKPPFIARVGRDARVTVIAT